HRVEPPEARARRVDRRREFSLVGDVGGADQRPIGEAAVPNEGLQVLGTAVGGQEQPRPLRRERLGESAADTAARTGDPDDSIREPRLHPRAPSTMISLAPRPGPGGVMRTLLIFPPQAHFTQPYLALPSLKAHLRANGFEDTHQWDVNLDSLEHFLAPARLERSRERVRERIDALP